MKEIREAIRQIYDMSEALDRIESENTRNEQQADSTGRNSA